MPDSYTSSRKFTKADLLAILGLLLYFGCMVWLHYIQQHPDPNLPKDILNDLPDHIAMMDGLMLYSLGSLLLKPVYLLGGDWGVSFFLSTLQAITVLVAAALFRRLAPRASRSTSVLLSLGCCTSMAIYTGGYWYLGTVTGTIYHNTTFVYMQLAALFTFFSFFRLFPSIREKLNMRWWCVYTFCLTLTTAFKPNFFLVFSPVLLGLLIWDLFQTKGKNLINEILVGCSTFPSLGISLVQSLILFGSENAGSLVVSPFTVWKLYSQNLPLDLIRSLLFILFVLVLVLVYGREKTLFLPHFPESCTTFFMLVVGVLECLLLAESGYRLADANFFWSAHSAMMFCTLAAAAVLYQMSANRSECSSGQCPSKILLVTGWGIFVLHLLSGWGYLILRLLGQRPI